MPDITLACGAMVTAVNVYANAVDDAKLVTTDTHSGERSKYCGVLVNVRTANVTTTTNIAWDLQREDNVVRSPRKTPACDRQCWRPLWIG